MHRCCLTVRRFGRAIEGTAVDCSLNKRRAEVWVATQLKWAKLPAKGIWAKVSTKVKAISVAVSTTVRQVRAIGLTRWFCRRRTALLMMPEAQQLCVSQLFCLQDMSCRFCAVSWSVSDQASEHQAHVFAR